MTGMNVTHYGREPYVMRKGYDPGLDLELLVRTYDDGTTTLSIRPGEFATDRTWSPEVVLTAEVPEPDCCATHDGPHVHGCVMPRRAGQTHPGPCRTRVTS